MLMLESNHCCSLNDLVASAKSGCTPSLEAVLTDARKKLHRYFRTRTRSEEDCEDLVQESLLRMYCGLSKIRQHASIDAYLYRIASHCLISYYTRGYRQRETNFSQIENAEDMLDMPQDSFETTLIEQLTYEQTWKLLTQIIEAVCSAVEMQVLILHTQHISSEAIAKKLQMKPVTVRTHLLRGRKKVLACLIQHFPEMLGGQEQIDSAINASEKEGYALSRQERNALQSTKPKKTHLQQAAAKLARHLQLAS